MRIKSSMTVMVTVLTVLILGGSPAFADNYVWIGANNDCEWCEPLNWDNLSNPQSGGYPGGNSDNDIATVGFDSIGPCEDITLGKLMIENGGCVNINNNHELNITRLLTIEHGGKLKINAGTVELSANNRKHKIGGDIILSSCNSTLLISGNASLDPFAPEGKAALQYGAIKGKDNLACIDICTGKTLTNNITICGMMTIQSVTCGSTTAGGESASAASSEATENIPTEKTADKAKPHNLRTKKTLRLAHKTTTSSVICYE